MKALFAPVVGFLNRLNYKAKFLAVLSIAAATGVIMAGQLYVQLDRDIEAARLEQRGLASYPAAVGVLTQMQQHRGLSAGLLGGNRELEAKVDAKARAVDDAVDEFDAVLAGPAADLGLESGWRALKQQWTALRDGGRGLGQAENFSRHTAMVEGMLTLITDLGERSSLGLDPEGASMNLITPMLHSIPEITERLGRLRGKGTGILASGSTLVSDRDAVVAQLAELSVTARALDENLRRAAEMDAADTGRLQGARREMKGAVDKLRRIATEEIVEGRMSLPSGQFFAEGTAVIDVVLRHLDESLRPTVAELLAQRLQRLEGRLALELGIAAGALGLLTYILFGMYFAILGSVRELTEGARQLADGDYTVRVRFSARDELAEVARQFNEMTENLGGLVRQVKARAGELASAAASLSGAAQNITGSSERQSEAATSMAAAIEEMTVSIGEIARHAEDAAEKSEVSGKLSNEGSDLTARAVSGMEQLAEVVERSARVIEKLGTQSSQISNIVSTIREIADQTNLLALNAAIEAARAGESGRGFAVVADEVRKLAERTALATGEITGMVDAIQSGTSEAVDTMSQGVEQVREGVELSGRSGEAMQQISSAATRVMASVRDINHALGEQGSASTEIARNVEAIARMAEENNESVKRTSQTAVRLEGVAGELLDQVSRFRV
ncbi:MAG: methyl-accepting chemotaxis protein [Rhodocyclaceae bacterium]|nr:methyl-accepting chemotaxis protein [Rhodocyclaceae bacterium]